MAGDWIKMRSNLWDDPRIARLCDATNKKEAEVVGGLYWLWAMADAQTTDGALVGLSVSTIDRKTGIKGLGVAVVDVGWLEEIAGGLAIVRFEEHNGKCAKRRALNARHTANHKANAKQKPENAKQSCLPSDEQMPETLRLEKRREEYITPVCPQGDNDQAEQAGLIRAKSLFTVGPVKLPLRLDRAQCLAWKKNKGAVEQTGEDGWLLLEEAYAQTEGAAHQYRRKDLAQLLNNWNGEITRAADWKARAGSAWWRNAAVVRQVQDPEGWREALEEIYPETKTDLDWSGLSADVRAQVLEFLKKKNGGSR